MENIVEQKCEGCHQLIKLARPEWGKVEFLGDHTVRHFINDEKSGEFIVKDFKTLYQIVAGALQDYGLDMRVCASDESEATVKSVYFCAEHDNVFIYLPKLCEGCELIELERHGYNKIELNDKEEVICLVNDKRCLTYKVNYYKTLDQVILNALHELEFDTRLGVVDQAFDQIQCALYCEEHKKIFLYF